MKQPELAQITLESCVDEAQEESLVLMRNGHPVALVIGVADLDEKQIELGSSDKFWKLITARCGQKTLSRAELESALDHRNGAASVNAN